MAFRKISRSTLNLITQHLLGMIMSLISGWRPLLECWDLLIVMLANHTWAGTLTSSHLTHARPYCACKSSWSKVALHLVETILIRSSAEKAQILRICSLRTLVAWTVWHVV